MGLHFLVAFQVGEFVDTDHECADRRIVRDKIALLKERLKEIDKQINRINNNENTEVLENIKLFYDHKN